jgi:hypothetical protein
MAAPVCPISKDQVINQPTTNNIPTIPLAYDLASALAAINAMRQAIQVLGRQITINNTFVSPGRQGGNNTSKSKPPSDGDFNEVPGSRKTETVRITQANNPNNYVEVEQINSIMLKDKSGETWVWKRG